MAFALESLETGRPQSGDRLPVEWACYDFLDREGIPYMRVDHDAADHMEDCRLVEEVLGAPIAKNLFLCNRQQTNFYLLLMDGNKNFRTKHLSAQLGCSRLSFATPEHLEQYLGVHPGSASPLGLLKDPDCKVQFVIDKPLLSWEFVGMHPCKNTSTLRMTVDDLLHRVLPALHHEPIIVELPEDTSL